ncbi:general substrate transporter [Exophiala viscosa]|uniref:general substrate transporter n=1 Tax=Exophiala viscosa TaxID=2486360 RepID=UPI0021A142FC|nr:general substrate transporter [Exophiala viscosa]
MATTVEKDNGHDHVQESEYLEQELITNVHYEGVDALTVAAGVEPVQKFSKNMIKLYFICGCMFLGATMSGYDASLMGNLLDLPFFQKEFNATILGAKAGLISAMYSIGGVSALPFVGPLSDTWGRRVGIATGCLIIIMGTILQGTSHDLKQYLAGRFFIGFGVSVAGACPAYIVEMVHPVYRGTITGLFNCCYYVGAVLAAAVLRGCLHYESNKSWLVPTWIQMVLPSILLLCCMFFPESPRWMYSHGQKEKCRQTLIKYHGNGNPTSIYVTLQMREFEQYIELEGADKRWGDYRVLFDSKASLYRVILCATAVPAFSQWTGQAGISYFLPAMLGTLGITSTADVLNLNLGIVIASGGAAVVGATLMDRFGRRKMLITCCAVMALMWVGMVACLAAYNDKGNSASAKGSLAFVFIIGIVFSFSYTPLQQLYPVECLKYEQRAKGIAFATMGTSATSLVNLFATPIALEKITWHTYIIWIGTNTAQALYYYFFMVETKGHTLEEMNDIFAANNPRKASLLSKAKTEEAVFKTKEAKMAVGL